MTTSLCVTPAVDVIVPTCRRPELLIGNHHLGTGPSRDVHVLKGVNMVFRTEALALAHGLCPVIFDDYPSSELLREDGAACVARADGALGVARGLQEACSIRSFGGLRAWSDFVEDVAARIQERLDGERDTRIARSERPARVPQ